MFAKWISSDQGVNCCSRITAYTGVMNTPRSQIVNCNTLLKEVETDTATLVQLVTDMDDLVLQFEITDAGHRSAEAWRRARVILDAGCGQGSAPAPTPNPQPAAGQMK